MIEINENALIEFFGVLPATQPGEEQEFFGTTAFEVDRGDFHLSFSVSKYHPGLSLGLQHKPTGGNLLSVSLHGLLDLKVESAPNGNTELLCRTVGASHESEFDENMTQKIMIRIDPAISIRMRTDMNKTE